MADTLQRFIASLRDHELPVSTAESLDAMQVAAAIGYADKQRLRLGLRAALVKHGEHQPRFDHCFSLFFDGTAPAAEDTRSAERMAHTTQGLGANAGSVGEQEDPELVIARAAVRVDLAQLRHFTQRGLFLRRLLNAAREDAAHLEDEHYQSRLEAAARAQIDRALQLTAQASSRQIQQQILKRVNLSSLEQRQHQAMQQLIRQLARKLVRQTRRRRRQVQRGQLDIGRTLRRNLPYQGIPVDLHWRRVKPRRARLFVCCDISGSVARHARWLLLFLHSLGEVLPATRSFVFTNHCVEVSHLFHGQDAAVAIEQALQAYSVGGSDYGASLEGLYAQIGAALRRNSTLLILGDARNNQGDARTDILQSLTTRAERVIWLNPESRSLWDTGDSIAGTYRRICHRFVECGNLYQLEKAVASLLDHR